MGSMSAASDPDRRENEARRSLFWALRSRVLTEVEMAEVARLGDNLNRYYGEPYNETEKMRQLNDAILQQFRLRAVARPA